MAQRKRDWWGECELSKSYFSGVYRSTPSRARRLIRLLMRDKKRCPLSSAGLDATSNQAPLKNVVASLRFDQLSQKDESEMWREASFPFLLFLHPLLSLPLSIMVVVELAVEIWERVMLHASSDDIQSFSMVSKQHHAISKTLPFRARFFLKRYQRCEAIHQASFFKNLFDSALLQVRLSREQSRFGSDADIDTSYSNCYNLGPSCLDTS